MLKSYFKIAFRNFRRHKLFTLINIIGLSIGISSAVVIYIIVQYDLSFDNFHKDGDRIYRVVTDFVFSGEPYYNGGVTGPLPEAVHNEATGLEESAAVYNETSYNVLIPSKHPAKFKDEQGMAYVDQHYFNIFTYDWLAGSAKTSLKDPYQVVLTSTEAKKFFPSLSYDQMLGKQVIYDDSLKMSVSGVVADLKGNTDLGFHNFISLITIQSIKNIKNQQSEWGSTNGSSLFFVKVMPNTPAARIEKQIYDIYRKHYPPKPQEKGSRTSFHLQQLKDIHFEGKYYGIVGPTANKTTLYGLMVIAAFLLLLGCINFINLTTAQSSQRAKEIGIRKTMGSLRSQLIGQFLSETFLVTLFAVIIAVCLTPVILGVFSDFIAKGIKADIIHRPDIILFLIVLAVVVSLLSGLYPAMVLSGYKPVLVLKNQAYANSGKTRNAWLRKTLTVTQFIIAQFFIMATLLVSKQIHYVLNSDLGFKKDAIVYFDLPWRDKNPAGHRQVMLNKIRSMPQVASVTLGGDIPSSNGWSSRPMTYKDGKKEVKTDVRMKWGDENYINTYQIKIIAGRNIKLSDSASGMLINKTYANILGFQNPQQAVGKIIDYSDKQRKIVVGVMGDFHQSSLHDPVKPIVLYPELQNMTTFHVVFKPQTAGGEEWKHALDEIKRSYQAIYPDDNFDYHFFDETIAKFYESEQHTSTLLTWATGLSIFISCLGLLGLAMYTTSLRTKEIGVRKVLGATVAQIVRMLSTELVLLVILAFVIVTPIAYWAMHKWMQNFADHTTISWWIFAISGSGMLLTALLTLSFQTVKAAIANPVKSLRSE